MSNSAAMARMAVGTVSLFSAPAMAENPAETVAAMDLAFQAAVKANDVETIDSILHPDFVMILGNGAVVSRDAVLAEARDGGIIYEQQDEEPGSQTVRMLGSDSAVVTAKLWIKGVQDGRTFDRRLWFSDTYVRTPAGWKYAFAQASLALPPE